MELSKLILEKKQKDEEKKNKEDMDRINALSKKLYTWFEAELVTVKDARILLRGMAQALEQSIQSKTIPIMQEQDAKTMKDFYATASSEK